MDGMDNQSLIEALREALGDSLLEPFYTALGELLDELDEREAVLDAKEAELEALRIELQKQEQDQRAVDTSEPRYIPPTTYDKQGSTYVDAQALPDRERHVLATIQVLAQPSGELLISNASLLQKVRSEFDPVTKGGLSACLTRLTHKGLISTKNMNGQGYPRIIVVEGRLEDPASLTHVETSE